MAKPKGQKVWWAKIFWTVTKQSDVIRLTQIPKDYRAVGKKPVLDFIDKTIKKGQPGWKTKCEALVVFVDGELCDRELANHNLKCHHAST